MQCVNGSLNMQLEFRASFDANDTRRCPRFALFRDERKRPMSKSVQRASENKVGGNVRQVSDAEQATQIVGFSEIQGNLTQQVLSDKKDEIKDVLEDVLAAVKKLGLKKGDKADLKAQTKTAQAQMKAKTPQPAIMSACLGSIWGTLKKAATTAAVSGAGTLATSLLDKIKAFVQ